MRLVLNSHLLLNRCACTCVYMCTCVFLGVWCDILQLSGDWVDNWENIVFSIHELCAFYSFEDLKKHKVIHTFYEEWFPCLRSADHYLPVVSLVISYLSFGQTVCFHLPVSLAFPALKVVDFNLCSLHLPFKFTSVCILTIPFASILGLPLSLLLHSLIINCLF